MKTAKQFLVSIAVIGIVASAGCQQSSEKKIVIAHRGASGYLPEHTLEAKAMAHAMEPDFIEQDVVLTKDNHAIVIHDHYLDTVTDVAKRFPTRKRADGRYYAIDFSLAEIKQLTLHERIDLESGKAVYPARFPLGDTIPFRIPTLEEEIILIQGLNASTGRNIGLYTELKAPWFHKKEGKDIARIVVEVLARYGYRERSDKCYLQCFDPECLRYIREEIRSGLRLIQLIADNSWDETPGVDYSAMITPRGLDLVATYADGIGPWMKQVVREDGSPTNLVALAHQRRLAVHPYTLRKDEIPSYAGDMTVLFTIFFKRAGVDGVFTDFPDLGVSYLKSHGYR